MYVSLSDAFPNQERPKFDIRDYQHLLVQAGRQRNRYECPSCGGNDFTIAKDGRYNCWSGCGDTKAIARALVEAAGGNVPSIPFEHKRPKREEPKRLPLEERDRQYRGALAHTYTFTDAHKEKLIQERGLTEADIQMMERLGFKSHLGPVSLNPNIATQHLGGVALSDGELLFGPKTPGLLIPFISIAGYVQGYQIGLDDRRDTKYRWLTGCHLAESGLMPLAYWQHPESAYGKIGDVDAISSVYYCEGGLKSLLVAMRLWQTDINAIVVGASGGNFNGVETDLGSLPVPQILLPDAGSRQKPNIRNNYGRLHMAVPTLQVAHWGQWDNKDFDDADDFLRAGGLWNICGWEDWKLPEEKSKAPSPPIDEADYWASEPAEVFGTDSPEEDLREDAAYQEYQRQQAEKEAEFQRQERENQQEDWQKQQADRDRIRWEQYHGYQYDVDVDSPYFVTNLQKQLNDDANWLLQIKSPLGTGKTQWLCDVVAYLDDRNQILLGYRNQLLLQTQGRFNERLAKVPGINPVVQHLNYDHVSLKNTNQFKLTFCVDSLIKFKHHLEKFDGCTVIIDEVNSVLVHMLVGSTCKNRRSQILDIFAELVKRARRIIVLDGHLADWVRQLLCKLRGQASGTFSVANNYNGNRLNIYSYLGVLQAETVNGNPTQRLKSRDRSELLDDLRTELECGGKVLIGTDSQLEAETLHNRLAEGMDANQILRIDSKTSDRAEIKQFLAKPNEYLVGSDIQIVIYTSSCESGIDINIKGHFTKAFYFFFGVLLCDGIIQMIGRLRDTGVPRYVWVSPYGLGKLETSNPRKQIEALEIYLEQLKNNTALDIPEGLESLTGAAMGIALDKILNDNPYVDVFEILKSIRAYETRNLRDCFHELIGKRHNLTQFHGESFMAESKAHKEAKEEVKQANTKQIFEAEDRKKSTIEAIEQDHSASWEQRCEAKKFRYLERLTGIADELVSGQSAWTQELLYECEYSQRNLISGVELYYLFQNPALARELEQHRWDATLFHQSLPFIGDISSRSLRVEALRELGLPELLTNPDFEFNRTTPEIATLHQKGKNKTLEAKLRVNWCSDVIKYLGKILESIGYCIQKKRQLHSGERLYEIVPRPSDYREPIANCVARRYQQLLDEARNRTASRYETNEKPSADADDVNFPENACNPDTVSTEDRNTLPHNIYSDRQSVALDEGIVAGFVAAMTDAIASIDIPKTQQIWQQISNWGQACADAVWQALDSMQQMNLDYWLRPDTEEAGFTLYDDEDEDGDSDDVDDDEGDTYYQDLYSDSD